MTLCNEEEIQIPIKNNIFHFNFYHAVCDEEKVGFIINLKFETITKGPFTQLAQRIKQNNFHSRNRYLIKHSKSIGFFRHKTKHWPAKKTKQKKIFFQELFEFQIEDYIYKLKLKHYQIPFTQRCHNSKNNTFRNELTTNI